MTPLAVIGFSEPPLLVVQRMFTVAPRTFSLKPPNGRGVGGCSTTTVGAGTSSFFCSVIVTMFTGDFGTIGGSATFFSSLLCSVIFFGGVVVAVVVAFVVVSSFPASLCRIGLAIADGERGRGRS